MPADAVHSPARKGRGTAQVQAPYRRAVGSEGRHGTEDDLIERVAPPANISMQKIGVASLHVSGPKHVAREDALAKSGGETLHLGLHALDVALALGRPVNRVR